jgi:hypothetical protein
VSPDTSRELTKAYPAGRFTQHIATRETAGWHYRLCSTNHSLSIPSFRILARPSTLSLYDPPHFAVETEQPKIFQPSHFVMVPAYVDKDMGPRPFLRVAMFCCMVWGWLHLLTSILGAYYGAALRKSWEKCPGRIRLPRRTGLLGEMSWENWAPRRTGLLGELGSYSRWIRLELLAPHPWLFVSP